MKYFIMLSLSIYVVCSITAQSVDLRLAGTNGGNVSGSQFQLEWSVGEPCIGYHSTLFGLLTEGVIQPGIFADQQDFSDTHPDLFSQSEPFELAAFPIPAGNHLNLTLNRPIEGVGYINVLDFTGQLMFMEYLPAGVQQWKLDMEQLPDGLYIVRLWTRQGEVDLHIKILKATPG